MKDDGMKVLKTIAVCCKSMKVLHQSRDFLVVEKPFDVLMNKIGTGDGDVTVHLLLKSQFPRLYDPSLPFGFRFVHRLDYSTSGALCVALTKEAAAEATRSFTERRTDKYYVALLRGHLSSFGSRDVRGVVVQIDESIGHHAQPEFVHRMCTEDDPSCMHPKRALTHLLVLEWGVYDGTLATKVLLKPITGRRHQIRLHCRSIGHTIVGDYTYSEQMDTAPHRMFLHAYRLAIPTVTFGLIDVTTCDPFAADDHTNKWVPNETLLNLSDPRIYEMFNFDRITR